MAAQTRLLPLLDGREAAELVFNRLAPAFLTCPWQESPEGIRVYRSSLPLIASGRTRQAKWPAIEANHDLLFLAPSLGD